MRKKRIVFAAMVLCILLTGIGCEVRKSGVPMKKKNTATERDTLRLYIGEITETVSPFFYLTQGDHRLLSLLYSKVMTTDQEECGRNDVATITVFRDKKNDSTSYRIRLKENSKDAEGKLLTSQDLLFNYYLRCQITYQGIDQVNQVNIVGLEEYQCGAKGSSLKQIRKKIEKQEKSDSRDWKKLVQQKIIIPVLQREYQWTKELYLYPEYDSLTKKYKKTELLFARLYALDTTYTGKGKNRQQVVEDIAEQYGTDYHKLSEVTGEEYGVAVRCLALQKICPEQTAGEGQIAGIRMVDEYEIEIQTRGYDKDDLERLGNIYLVPGGEYDFSEIMVNVGQVDNAENVDKTEKAENRKKRLVTGTGNYILDQKPGNGWLLKANTYAINGTPDIWQIQLTEEETGAVECLQQIKKGDLDMACIWEYQSKEKEVLKKELEEEDAWKVRAKQGVLYSTERVNATTLPEKMSCRNDVLEYIGQIKLLA